MKIWLVLAILVQLGASVLSQQTCGNFADLMVSHRLTTQRFKQQATKYICHHHTKKQDVLNKFDPMFDSPVYVAPTIRVDTQSRADLVTFSISDRDTPMSTLSSSSQFLVETNDTNFYVQFDSARNLYTFNFQG